MTMQTRQQLETDATFHTALRRRDEGTPTPLGSPNREILGRKKDLQAFLLAVNRIRVDDDQVRQRGKGADDEETKQLAESIREHGLLHAIDVRWIEAADTYEIVAGERRFTAVRELLAWTDVPVRVLTATDDQIVWLQ